LLKSTDSLLGPTKLEVEEKLDISAFIFVQAIYLAVTSESKKDRTDLIKCLQRGREETAPNKGNSRISSEQQ
jgi:hypothetical protein